MIGHHLTRRGFTIVELLIVIVVIGIIATLVVVGYQGITNKAVDTSVLSDIETVDTAETDYGLNNAGTSKAWYSGASTVTVDTDLKVSPSSGNIIDVVVNSTDYCIRIYNPKASTYNSLSTAATKESSTGACTTLAASAAALADSSGGGGGGGSPTYAAITWTQQAAAGLRAWADVASSSDGTKLAAAANGDYIYTSSDSGVTWTARTSAGSRAWYSIASSADGTRLAATVDGGYIYTSSDSGATWTQRTSAGSRQWWGRIASSADGMKLVTSPNWGYPYTSTDGGSTWVSQSATGYNNWRGFDISSDGTKIVGVASSNPVWISTDSGSTWASQAVSSVQWYDATMSSDGTKIVISPTGNQGPLYRSTNTGTSFAALTNLGSGNCWQGLASSSDGTKLAGSSGTCGQGYIYLSKDSGASWTEDQTLGRANWKAIASSTNGAKLVTAADSRYVSSSFVANGYVFTGVYN